ncbi:hypothetical protein [Cellulophaga sp. L1A9]|uniref:hypothetical protein n=1 Tax=Cellulophaga sp. L1A9 TaxID=2686362 RepID=UPI00131EBE16|nr:hypothetical protein [Cellulophaga sp. L1A9]
MPVDKNNNLVINELQKKIYYIYYDLGIPFEININGIKVEKGKGHEIISNYIIINPFLIKEDNSITLSINHKNISPELIDQIKIELYVGDIVHKEDVELIKTINFSEDITQKIANKMSTTFNFDPDIYYESNYLNDAMDLSNDNLRENLLIEVLDFYNEIHDIIDSGDYKEYLKKYEKSNAREMNSMYYDTNEKENYLNKLSSRVVSSKGFMQPLDKYHLSINQNNKIISLEHEKYASPLYSIDSLDKIKTYGMMLYKSSDGKLKIY